MTALEQADVFVSGQEGYDTFRIPSLIVAGEGTVLAFCEGRRHGRGDSGEIHTVLKRSLDGGTTWGPLQVVAADGPNTAGNPCPVLDRATGTLWLLLTHNLGEDTERRIRDGTSRGTREVWLTQSADAGATWPEPHEITRSVKDPGWTWYATGPGVGIQLRSGRLLIPCDHTVAGSGEMRSHVIYSDDGGTSWHLGGVAGPPTNECQVAELDDGSLLLNMRSYHGRNRRAVATSRDGGLTWSEVTLDPALVEPVCQASLLALPTAEASCRLLFSNPASTRRENLTVRLSEDEGRSWPIARTLHPDPSAYSCLTLLPDGRIGCLYERGDEHPYERISLARFSLEWLAERGLERRKLIA